MKALVATNMVIVCINISSAYIFISQQDVQSHKLISSYYNYNVTIEFRLIKYEVTYEISTR